jgi:hypothetical protein
MIVTLTQPPLFDLCPVPRCGQLPVDDGRPCGDCCREIAAGYIREVGPAATGPEPTLPPSTATRLVTPPQPAPGGERKANQLCWMCDQRRTCRPDPAFEHARVQRWICPACESDGT